MYYFCNAHIIFPGANPVWNPEEVLKPNGLSNGLNPLYRDDDKEFDDSESNDGDDVFIGIENQDDFKGYKDRYDVSFKNTEMNISLKKVESKYVDPWCLAIFI